MVFENVESSSSLVAGWREADVFNNLYFICILRRFLRYVAQADFEQRYAVVTPTRFDHLNPNGFECASL